MGIQRVGIRGVRYPLQLKIEGAVLPTVAEWALDVALPAEQKGTHMSRFVAWLDALGEPVDANVLRREAARMLVLLGAEEGRVEASFPFFLRKRAPISGVASLLVGLEDRLDHAWCDAAAGVGFAHADETPDMRLGMVPDMGFINVNDGDADGELAAARHGIAGVDGKIHQDLFNHAGVAMQERDILRRLEPERDMFANEALQHFGQIVHDLAQIEMSALHHILAAEHEQLSREAGGAFGGEEDGLHRVHHLGRQRLPGKQRAGMALDDGEHVVEVVRDTGGELADGLHFLRLAQLRLEAQPFGDVLCVAMDDLAGLHRMK